MKKECLIIVSHKLHEINSKTNKIYVKGGFPVLTNEISKFFNEVILCVPVRYDNSILPNVAYRSNIRIKGINLGYSYYGKAKKVIEIAKIIKDNNGVVYAMAPNMTGLLGMIWAFLFRRPFFVSVDTDKAEVIKLKTENEFWGFIKSKLIEIFHYSLIKKIAKNKPLFVTGDMFLGKNKNWYQWVKSTHKTEEIKHYKPPQKNDGNEPFKIIFVGRLSPEKNIDVLLKALKKIPEENYRLTIVGEGSEHRRLKGIVNSLNLSNVDFKGYVDNETLKESRFLEADLLVLPSKSERQGKVLLEAMASSVPIIASNTKGIASIVKHRVNGMLFNPYNSSELSNQIKEIKKNYKLRQKITKNGYDFSRSHTLDKEVEKIINTVNEHYA